MRRAGIEPVDRLKRRREFLWVAAGRLKAAAPGLVLQARRRDDGDEPSPAGIRIGYTASRRVGPAVVRNRARRRLRAAVHDVMVGLARDDHDYVLVARATTIARPYDALLSDLRGALRRIGALAPQADTADKALP